MYLSRFLIKLWIFIHQILWGGTFYMDHPVYMYMYKKLRYRSQFWSDIHEIHLVGAGPLMGEPYSFWKQLAQ